MTNRVHATENIDEIIHRTVGDICALFAADRLTIYVIDENGRLHLVAGQTGLHSIHHPPAHRREQRGGLRYHRPDAPTSTTPTTSGAEESSARMEFRREVG